uniref:Uncharacterized protein n=1 Tax=Tanacetum cinerariifolium TaxID=118510 RepID=A0A699STP1_TANCI|nr:hypothetical protein [Tanacetum cinerariifolium]
METQQLLARIEALPQQARVTIEQLVLLLGQQPVPSKMPPIMRSAMPLTEEEKLAEQSETSGWAARTDITDGATYIHERYFAHGNHWGLPEPGNAAASRAGTKKAGTGWFRCTDCHERRPAGYPVFFKPPAGRARCPECCNGH